MRKHSALALLAFLAACYSVAIIASLVTRPEIPVWYESLAKPAWRPPNWLFGPVWTLLYGMMAVAAWRVWRKPPSSRRFWALSIFWLQLAANFLWSPMFFRWHAISYATAVIVSLAVLIALFMASAWRVDRLAALLFLPYLFWVSFASVLNYTIWRMNSSSIESSLPSVSALQFTGAADPDGFPPSSAWERAEAIRFDHDWRGQNPDPQRETEVRLLWTRDALFLRFLAHYRDLTVFSDARPDGWRDHLWDRDVAETFLQPDSSDPRVYKEIEVSPNGFWIDLNISHGELEEMHSGLRRRVIQNTAVHTWTADLAIPMHALTASFDPAIPWRANFFRIEGEAEPRFYAAWSPTGTPKPNFHVPAAFGHLVFRKSE